LGGFEVNRGGAFPGFTVRAGFLVTAQVLRRVPLVQAIRTRLRWLNYWLAGKDHSICSFTHYWGLLGHGGQKARGPAAHLIATMISLKEQVREFLDGSASGMTRAGSWTRQGLFRFA
jgi:hypothetical protein